VNVLPYLADSHAEDDLREAIADLAGASHLERQDFFDRLDGHVSPDNCGICGGEGCDACLDCGCSRPKCRQKRGQR